MDLKQLQQKGSHRNISPMTVKQSVTAVFLVKQRAVIFGVLNKSLLFQNFKII